MEGNICDLVFKDTSTGKLMSEVEFQQILDKFEEYFQNKNKEGTDSKLTLQLPTISEIMSMLRASIKEMKHRVMANGATNSVQKQLIRSLHTTIDPYLKGKYQAYLETLKINKND